MWKALPHSGLQHSIISVSGTTDAAHVGHVGHDDTVASSVGGSAAGRSAAARSATSCSVVGLFDGGLSGGTVSSVPSLRSKRGGVRVTFVVRWA